ncbi:MAG: hypothetical protein CSYNP_04160 [Syntrophus sp. SKADARSKE-3]|nr:hypothetical protein [Syntrophus sp. SKADARSKE-3]
MCKKLILCSVDMCNSTQAKSYIESKEIGYRQKLYQELASKLVKNEMIFYSQLERHYRKGTYSPSTSSLYSRIFVLKNIGDEFWFCVEPDEGNPYDVANILYSLYLAASFRYDELIIDEQELTIEQEMDWCSERDFIRVPITFKIYADLIDDYINYSETRFNTFNDYFHTMLFPDDKRTDDEIKKLKVLLLNQLNIFSSEGVPDNSNKLRGLLRTDLLGYQVDHFFRFSKYAARDLFSIGDRLFREANPEFINRHLEPNTVTFKIGRPGGTGQFKILNYSHQKEGKGISNPYSIHYLTERPDINEIRHQNNKMKDANVRTTYLLLRQLGALKKVKRNKS